MSGNQKASEKVHRVKTCQRCPYMVPHEGKALCRASFRETPIDPIPDWCRLPIVIERAGPVDTKNDVQP